MKDEQKGSLVLAIHLLADALATGDPRSVRFAQTTLDAVFPREKVAE